LDDITHRISNVQPKLPHISVASEDEVMDPDRSTTPRTMSMIDDEATSTTGGGPMLFEFSSTNTDVAADLVSVTGNSIENITTTANTVAASSATPPQFAITNTSDHVVAALVEVATNSTAPSTSTGGGENEFLPPVESFLSPEIAVIKRNVMETFDGGLDGIALEYHARKFQRTPNDNDDEAAPEASSATPPQFEVTNTTDVAAASLVEVATNNTAPTTITGGGENEFLPPAESFLSTQIVVIKRNVMETFEGGLDGVALEYHAQKFQCTPNDDDEDDEAAEVATTTCADDSISRTNSIDTNNEDVSRLLVRVENATIIDSTSTSTNVTEESSAVVPPLETSNTNHATAPTTILLAVDTTDATAIVVSEGANNELSFEEDRGTNKRNVAQTYVGALDDVASKNHPWKYQRIPNEDKNDIHTNMDVIPDFNPPAGTIPLPESTMVQAPANETANLVLPGESGPTTIAPIAPIVGTGTSTNPKQRLRRSKRVLQKKSGDKKRKN
jgi:hypothetical protein